MQRLLVVPGHPVGRMRDEFVRVLEQLGQIVEGVDAVQFTGVDQTHEQIAHVGTVFRLVEVRILAVQNRLFQCSLADVVIQGGLRVGGETA